MKKSYKISTLLLMCVMLVTGLTFTSCSNDDLSTDQFKGGVSLNVFGPSPVARGGELRFIGSGMNQINSIEIPGCGAITDINVISDTEIRVTVPQTAEVGYVTLNGSNDVKITTKTKLTYTEPISLDEITPMTIKPGEELTINGDYLNLINEVIFPDDVVVTDFTTHTRKQIKLIVPAEAKTGKIIISDGAETPNWIYSDEEVNITLPATSTVMDLTNVKPGTVVKQFGSNLDLVVAVVMPNGEEVEFNVQPAEEGSSYQTLTFTLPENVSDGAITMVTASGVAVAIANIGVAVPSELVATPASELRADDVITVKGVNMELVTSVTFPSVADAVEPASTTATEITVKMPAAATTGDMILNTASGKSAKVAIATAKPENISYSSTVVPAGESMTITGKNLDVVTMIKFGGNVVLTGVKATSPSELTFKVPVTAETGELTLMMDNGESVSAPSITVTKPTCAFLPSVPEKFIQGEIVEMDIVNGDFLTGVTINGEAAQFINNKSTGKLSISIPSNLDGVYPLRLVSSNGEITYQISIVAPEDLIWEGSFNVGNWGGFSTLAWGGYDFSKCKVGDKLRVYFTEDETQGYWQMRISNGSWADITGQGDISLGAGQTSIDYVLDANAVNELHNNGGLVLTGCFYTVTKVVWVL